MLEGLSTGRAAKGMGLTELTNADNDYGGPSSMEGPD